jgi:hypothetical protein
MARKWFKQWWMQIVPWTIERSTYVLCASLALILLFWQWQPIGIVVWSIDAQAARIALWTICAAGWLTVLAVTFLINHFDLFGLQQVFAHAQGRKAEPPSFRTPLVLSICPSSDLFRLSARVLGNASDDGRSFAIRHRDDRLHLHRHPARRARPGHVPWHRLCPVPRARVDDRAHAAETVRHTRAGDV